MWRALIRTILLSLALISLASCGAQGPGPGAWLDQPLHESRYPLGPLEVVGHASSANGIASFEFLVDGSVVSEERAAGGRMEMVALMWDPPHEGVFSLGLRAIDGNGIVGVEARVKVVIGDVEVRRDRGVTAGYGYCDDVDYFHILAEPSVIPPQTCTVLQWEIGAPEEWPVFARGEPVGHSGELPVCLQETDFLDVVIETPLGPCSKWQQVEVTDNPLLLGEGVGSVQTFIEVEPSRIVEGECAQLSWEVTPRGDFAVLLNDEPADFSGQMEVCPLRTSPYVVTALHPDNPKEAIAIVEVLPAELPPQPAAVPPPAGGQPPPTPLPTPTPAPTPDTTPPVISNLTVTTHPRGLNRWIYIWPCDNDPCVDMRGFNLSATITDDVSSGHDIIVRLFWTGNGVRDGDGNEQLYWTGTGNDYAYTLTYFYNVGSMSDFRVTATDKAGNVATVFVGWTLTVRQCECR